MKTNFSPSAIAGATNAPSAIAAVIVATAKILQITLISFLLFR
jgi:hypothetical protein